MAENAMFVTTSQYQKTPNKKELQNRIDRIVEICDLYKDQNHCCEHIKKIALGESH